MGYSITLSGEADLEDAQAIFEDTVRALRTITPDGVVSGQFTGLDSSAGGVQQVTTSADSVVAIAAADATEG